ncbi:SH3 domain-containing protein [Breznakiella homolactica]|uniref:SH3 domain-containing protein n=1 Tax=Breznakiella homolactica TaxID=2798577 RepID=A0A7T8BBX0_9SPIR|nr:SH3 domain-containing protein [Breznakiella homolactica]QQO09633.1 SH3 domain-containing protein [Breznakiella homolactica]
MKQALIISFLLFFALNIFAQINDDYEDELKPFEFENGIYYMLDSPVNIRSQPNLKGTVVGKLGLHDEIEIIENIGNIQELKGVTQNWYKIKFNDITGYIWGGYISASSIKSSLDKIDTDYYIYYRISFIDPEGLPAVYLKDIFIYNNNIRLTVPEDNDSYYRPWRDVYGAFSESGNTPGKYSGYLYLFNDTNYEHCDEFQLKLDEIIYVGKNGR